MVSLGHIKQRLGQYGAVWVIAFLVSGAAVLIGMLFTDMMVAMDLVLPPMLALTAVALGTGLVATWLSKKQSLGTKLAVLALAVLLALPLLWAPVSAAVAIAFVGDRSIEYSQAYAGFQIGVARVLYPMTEAFLGADLWDLVWAAFQVAASIVGFLSALFNIWPRLKRLLGPEPAAEDA